MVRWWGSLSLLPLDEAQQRPGTHHAQNTGPKHCNSQGEHCGENSVQPWLCRTTARVVPCTWKAHLLPRGTCAATLSVTTARDSPAIISLIVHYIPTNLKCRCAQHTSRQTISVVIYVSDIPMRPMSQPSRLCSLVVSLPNVYLTHLDLTLP